MSRNIRPYGKWLGTLVAGAMLASPAWAQQPAESEGRAVTVESILSSWESAEGRLTSLLDQVPSEAHRGIERAIEANRKGRQRALDALNEAGADQETGQARAQQALEKAALHAGRGLDEARKHVPADVLPRLDEAAAKMQAGLASGGAGIARETGQGSRPASIPGADRPESRRPADFGRPTNVGRPASVGRPSRGPGR